MKRITIGLASLALALLMGVSFSMPNAFAAEAHHRKVNCEKVMHELKTGKKVKDVAKDLKISTSSVYRCRRREKMEAKHEAKMPKMGGSTTTK